MTNKETELSEENTMKDDVVENNSADGVEPSTSEQEVPEEATEVTALEKAEKEAAEMKSRWLRSVADMENFRKRIAREKQDIIRSAAANVVESLLPVLDNMKLGLQAAENHPESSHGARLAFWRLARSGPGGSAGHLVPHQVCVRSAAIRISWFSGWSAQETGQRQ